MFHVKSMSAEDFEFAVGIADQMSWGLTEADFEFMIELEPEGCFVLLQGSERIGIATTVSFGKIGWFGNLVVTADRRKRGGGSLLVKHALKYLSDRGVKTVGLYAYMERIQFYTSLGFSYDSDFIALKGRASSSSTLAADVREAKKHEIDEIVSFDQNCFGASRKKLLEPILLDPDNLCHTYVESGHISGFVLAKLYSGVAELGPLVCNRGQGDIATGLLTAALNRLSGLEVSMCIPKKEATILDVLTKLGFTERFRVARMFFGPTFIRDCICAAESLERG